MKNTILLLILISFCGCDHRTLFERAVGIPLPKSMKILHEYQRPVHDITYSTYYSEMLGNLSDFDDLTRALGLMPATREYGALAPLLQEPGSWWKPPGFEEQDRNPHRSFLITPPDPKTEEFGFDIALLYDNGKIWLSYHGYPWKWSEAVRM